ncbi:MAG: L,D-transpeptidase family protein [bacterium]
MRSRKQGGPFDLLRVYPICAYSGTLGPKQKEGDRQAPEGFYTVTLSALNPHSRYHLSFNLGYPNQYDRAHGRTGSYLMVHGNCVSIGCYAMTDEGIEEIYKLVEASLNSGSKQVSIHIFPFHMTPENLNKHSTSVWLDFWQNLQEGYDWFDRNRYPPRIAVVQKRYHILNENSQP